MTDLDGVSLNLVEDFDDAAAFMGWLGERRPVLACDTETGGLEWYREPLRLVQFGDLSTGWAIPWERWGGLAADALRRYRGPLAFHNAKFDMHFLRRNGVKVRRSKVHDTMTLAKLLDPINRARLKDLAVRHVDRRAANGQSELKRAMALHKWTWATVPVDLEAYWAYAALDPVLTCHLYQKFRPKVVGPLDDVYELEVATIMVLLDLEPRGVRVDLAYAAEAAAGQLARAAKARAWVRKKYGFDAGSYQVAAALQRDGVKLTARTRTGKWCLDKEVLEPLADEHKLARMVMRVRKAEHVAKAYFGNFAKYADGDLLHPSIWPIGARTGRQSVERPALQQLPRSSLVRDAFIAREGNSLLAVDWDQLEYRLMGHFSKDKGLIGAFGAGDFFLNLAREIYNDPAMEKSDARRQRTKSTAYSKAYGAGAETAARTAKVPVAEMEKIIANFDARFPGVRRYQRDIIREAQQRAKTEGTAYVTTTLGRRQPVEDEDAAYKLTNYMIQGTGADLFKRALVDVDAAGLADALVLPVHDEMLFDVATENAEELGREVVKVFEAQGDGYRVPLTAGASVMQRWGDKYRA